MPSIINATTSTGLVTTADNSGSLQLATNSGTTAVTIDTSQNVGIGITPDTKFEVSGTGAVMRVSTNHSTSGTLDLSADATAAQIKVSWYNSAVPLVFKSGNTEQMRLDTSGSLQFNSGYGSVATAYGCRAWVNFNGTGTPAIRASGNISSISDNGTGAYSVNFTTLMPDANYGGNVSVCGMPGVSDANFVTTDQNNTLRSNPTTSSFSFTCFRFQGSPIDPDFARVSIFR